MKQSPTMIAEQIKKIKSLREQKAQIIKEEYEQTRPFRTDLDKIPSLFDKFNEAANPKNKDNIKIFVFLIHFMYSPMSCINKGVRGGVRRRLAKLFEVSNSAITVQFGNAKVLFEKHYGFRKEAERLYQCLIA